MRNLLLTTGHNSSAILVEDDRVVWGYETERFTGVKSDSHFPAAVLDAKHLDPRSVDMIYASHWDPHGLLRNMKAKHYVPTDGVPVRSYSPDFTHHDGHAYAAINFADPDPFSTWHVLVVDGFGNYGEHFSVYEVEFDDLIAKPKLLQRFRGYNTSLGLMYQYATAFVGMKMNEDEYKFLGYEARIDSALAEPERAKLDGLIFHAVNDWISEVGSSCIYAKDDPVFNLDALEEVKATRFRELSKVLDAFAMTDASSHAARCIVGYYVQGVLEGCVHAMIDLIDRQGQDLQLICTGGCFMNVKLNNSLLNRRDVERLSVHPLCGDQGNALGMYARDNPSFRFPNDLFWGHRELKLQGHVEGLFATPLSQPFWDHVAHSLEYEDRVNVVRGAMEFGPRALCHTSTLAKPTMENVEFINGINARNTIMPMAPVVTREFYLAHFKHSEKLHNSERFMICALDYASMQPEWAGAANEYVDLDGRVAHTGRPQVIDYLDDPELYAIVEMLGGILINTSYNYHGKPICNDVMDVIETHRLNRSHGSNMKTYVLETSR